MLTAMKTRLVGGEGHGEGGRPDPSDGLGEEEAGAGGAGGEEPDGRSAGHHPPPGHLRDGPPHREERYGEVQAHQRRHDEEQEHAERDELHREVDGGEVERSPWERPDVAAAREGAPGRDACRAVRRGEVHAGLKDDDARREGVEDPVEGRADGGRAASLLSEMALPITASDEENGESDDLILRYW